MDAAEFHSETGEAILHDGRNLFVFGSALVAECSRRMYGEDLDEVCAAFRALSDKTKLMLLMRLSEGRSYCQQLAEENSSNTGNMSRSLAALTRHGFLKQEQEQFRTYYTTDIDGIGQFFGEVQDLFKGGEMVEHRGNADPADARNGNAPCISRFGYCEKSLIFDALRLYCLYRQ